MTIENPAAFPAGWPEAGYKPHYGMTMRDYFAAQMAPHILMRLTGQGEPNAVYAYVAEHAYAFSDAMLAERKRNDR